MHFVCILFHLWRGKQAVPVYHSTQQYQGPGHLGCMNAQTICFFSFSLPSESCLPHSVLSGGPRSWSLGRLSWEVGFPLPFRLLPSTPREDDRLDQACGSLLHLLGRVPFHAVGSTLLFYHWGPGQTSGGIGAVYNHQRSHQTAMTPNIWKPSLISWFRPVQLLQEDCPGLSPTFYGMVSRPQLHWDFV